MNEKNLTNLKVEIFHPKLVTDAQLHRYNEVFDLWNAIWIETRLEVNPALPTPSDNFSRQDEVIAVFNGNRPIAMVCNRYVDIRQSWCLDDSFFKGGQWPNDALLKLPALGNTFALASHAFVHPDFRKINSGLPTKNLVCALSFVQANAAESDVFLAMMRKDRGMHSLFQRCGGSILVEDVSFYHIPVDLMAAYPARAQIEIETSIKPIVDELAMNCPKLGKNYFETYREAMLNQKTTNDSKSQRRVYATGNSYTARRTG